LSLGLRLNLSSTAKSRLPNSVNFLSDFPAWDEMFSPIRLKPTKGNNRFPGQDLDPVIFRLKLAWSKGTATGRPVLTAIARRNANVQADRFQISTFSRNSSFPPGSASLRPV
jgi:hypothetical protein